MYPFKNLVFQGGGVKGIAYGGALQVLESKGIPIQKLLKTGSVVLRNPGYEHVSKDKAGNKTGTSTYTKSNSPLLF